MISEPELVGGTDFPEAVAPLPPQRHEPKPPRARRPWLWALGGAVAASAVWAGALAVHERRDEAEGPDLRGYRAQEDPCAKAALPGLTSAFGPKKESTNPLTQDHPALFRAECSVSLDAKPTPYDVLVTYTLHRVTDPRPEFEAQMADPLQGGGDRISGVGQLAYVKEDEAGTMELHVLDGHAVVSFSLSPVLTYEEDGPQPAPPELDPAATRTFLVEDMNALLAALRK
ncbi:hypothetical protein [Streptomyces sp. NPDC013740]|uniref:hypothetical protein n=1 Tax=Streptomyces sp. NPDC013740 TaxID=3364867 RepID=UPI0036FB5156